MRIISGNFKYSIAAVFYIIYSFAIFAIEGGRLGLILPALWKGVLSGLLNLILITIAQGLFGLKRKSKKSKVSAYPWS